MGAQKEKIQKMTENLFKQIMAEYFSKLGRGMGIQVHESIASHTDLRKNKQKTLSIQWNHHMAISRFPRQNFRDMPQKRVA